MIGDKAMFSSISPKDGGYVTFGDNAKGKIVGEGKIGKSPNLIIDDVLIVNGLKHNLMSISQFYDKNCKVVFKPSRYVVYDDNECALFVGSRMVQGITIFMLLTCLIPNLSMKNVLLVLMMILDCSIDG